MSTADSLRDRAERLRERDAKRLAQPIIEALKEWSSREDVIQALRASRPTEIFGSTTTARGSISGG